MLDVDTGDAPRSPGPTTASTPGDVVVAVTAGRHRRRATWGQVSATEAGFRGPRGRPIVGAIEHTAPCGPGSSGAPVLDRAGRVVGINTHRLEHGFYLARAVDEALRDAVAAMAEGRRFERLRLGVALAPADVAARLRRSVGPRRARGAARARRRRGFAGRGSRHPRGRPPRSRRRADLRTPDDLFAVLAPVEPGGELALALVRGAEELIVTAAFPA